MKKIFYLVYHTYDLLFLVLIFSVLCVFIENRRNMLLYLFEIAYITVNPSNKFLELKDILWRNTKKTDVYEQFKF